MDRHADRVLLDTAGGQPLHPAAHDALLLALDDGWADPRRLAGSGRQARQLLDAAREVTATCLGARPDEVRFLPSHVHALYESVRATARARERVSGRVVHSTVEHSAVLHAAGERDAVPVPVDRLGRVDVAAFAVQLEQPAALACLIAASHEVGTTQPVEEVAALCEERGVPLLVDAGAVLGHAPAPTSWSLLAGSSRSWGGPPGVGVLAVRAGIRQRGSWPQEEGPVGEVGDLPLPLVVAAAAALDATTRALASEDARLRPLVERVRAAAAALPGVDVVGDPVGRLPHLVTFSCLYLDGESLVRALDAEGFEVASGSACTSSTLEPSHVLAAMGALTHGNVRLSLGRTTTVTGVERFLAVLPGVVDRLRADAGVQDL